MRKNLFWCKHIVCEEKIWNIQPDYWYVMFDKYVVKGISLLIRKDWKFCPICGKKRPKTRSNKR